MMKNYSKHNQFSRIKTVLYLSVILNLLCPSALWSADDSNKSKKVPTFHSAQKSQKIFELKEYAIKGYETCLVCTFSENRQPLTEINFDIYERPDGKTRGEKIGALLLQYYPSGGYYQTSGKTSVLRLRHIEINDSYQQQYHATRALETLFRQLRTTTILPKETEIWLEYNVTQSFLKRMYASFGFEETQEPTYAEIKILKVLVSKSKFPYFAKLQEKNTKARQ